MGVGSWANSTRGLDLKENNSGLIPKSILFLTQQTENMVPVLMQVKAAKRGFWG